MIKHGQKARLRRVRAVARLEALETRQLLSMFTVTTSADSGTGSLRDAITSANSTTGSSTIDFDIPGTGVQTIALASALPTLINPVVIDGTSQPGYDGTPLIEIEGAGILDSNMNAIPDVNGLVLTGGSSTVEGLTIDQFTGSGIVATRDSNTISGNYIGTDPTGKVAEGNGGYGIVVSGRNNLIGGITQNSLPGTSVTNVISSNILAGIYLGSGGSALSTNNVVEGNLIGTDVTGTVDLGNAGAGIDIESSNNTIGAPNAPNVIDFNGGPGVEVGDSPYLTNVIHNRIEGNSIFSNVGLGIDLGDDGVTPNDPGYPYGPNNRQTFPVLTSAYPSTTGSGTTVEGSLVSEPNTAYTIDFYSNIQPDGSGYGQGQVPIGSETVITDANGYADVTKTLPTVAAGQYISATATNPNFNTSEFSFSTVVTNMAESALTLTPENSYIQPQADSSVTYVYLVQNNGPSLATNVTFTDTLPTGATDVSATAGSLNLPAPVDGVITANLGKLADGASTYVDVTFTLPTPGKTSSTIGVTADQNPSGVTTVQNIVVNPASPIDLSVYGYATPFPVQVSQELTYTFVVTNNGANQATGVTFTDPLPMGLVPISASSSQGTANIVGNKIIADLGILPGGANATVTIVATPTTPGLINNIATVGGNEPDYNQINNMTTVYSYATPAPTVDLATVIQQAPYPATVDQPLSYNVLVGNPGTAAATGVTLVDVLPQAAAIVSIKASQGTYYLIGDVLTVNLGDLAVGAVASVTLNLVPGAPGFLVDSASVNADQVEQNITNNFAQVVTPVIGPSTAPAVLEQKLLVSGNKITGVVLTFNEDMNSDSASMIANYEIFDLGQNGSLSASGKKVTIASAKYNAVTRSVTLTFKTDLSIGKFYKVVANGQGSPGLMDVNGNLLDGENNGLQNSIYESLIGVGTKTRPVQLQIGVPKPKPTPKLPAKHHK